MQIVSTNTPDLDHLSAFYNHQVAPIPYCLPVTPKEFIDKLVLSVRKRLSAEYFFIAQDQGHILGFAHVGIHKTVFATKGVVRFLTFLPTYPHVGKELIETYENYLIPHGITEFTAFQGGYGYPFYNAGRETLPGQCTHLLAQLGNAGYSHSHRMIFMERRNLNPDFPSNPNPSGKISITPQKGKGEYPNLMVQLFIGGRQVGACESESLGHYQYHPAAQDIYYIGNLGIDPEFQFQGWGKYLLHRTHWEMAQLGYKHALIGTEQDNYRALLLYLNDGYRFLFMDYGFAKKISST